MKKLSKYLLIAFLLILTTNAIGQVSGFDQVGTTSFQFLKVIPSARAGALGDAVSTTIQTSEAAFFNPAALTNTPNMDVSLSYLDYFLDVNITSLAMSYRVPSIGTFAVHALVTDLGEIEETRADQLFRDDVTGVYNPGISGSKLSASSMALGLSFARSLTNKFSFGLTTKFVREDLIAKAVNAVVFDGGILYRTGFKSLDLGIMLRNFGAEVKYFEKSYPLPQTFTIGVSGLLIGSEGAFVRQSESNRLLLAYDLSQTRDHSQQQHIGLEYGLSDFLMVRGGYKFNFDEEGLTLGLGVKVSRFQIDYAYSDYGEFLDDVQRFTINFLIK